MLVTLVGLGCGTSATMTAEGLEALRQADCLLGAGRLLAAVPENCTAKRVEATRPRQILDALLESGAERPCVVYSGDTGFYSGARGLLALLEAEKIAYRVLPGISSVQLLAARLGLPASFRGELSIPIPVSCGVRFRRQAQFHPLRFLSGIVGNLTIYENTPRPVPEQNGSRHRTRQNSRERRRCCHPLSLPE